jgi:hypothetical protein
MPQFLSKHTDEIFHHNIMSHQMVTEMDLQRKHDKHGKSLVYVGKEG